MNNEKGMTLVELMVAVVIISLALVSMLNMFDLGVTTTNRAYQETKAVELAQQKMEEVKYSLNNSLPVTIGLASFEEPENQDYEYEVEISTVDGLKEIKVTVYYGSKNVVLVTRLGERP